MLVESKARARAEGAKGGLAMLQVKIRIKQPVQF